MGKVRVVAHDYIKKENLEYWKQILKDMVDQSFEKDKGCLEYMCLQDDKDPTHFAYFEIWESDEAVAAHLAQPHFQHFKEERAKLWIKPTESRHYIPYYPEKE